MGKYGFWGLFYMIYCVIRTKLLFPNARIIRFPFDVRDKEHITIGKNFTAGRNCRFEGTADIQKGVKTLLIGDNVQVNDFVHITAGERVEIQDNVLIASKVYISDTVHGSYGKHNIHSDPTIPPSERPLINSPVVIEENVWLGDGVCVLPNVTIGKGSIVGANAVVTKSIPAFSIAAGIPARVIKKYNFDSKKWENIR